MSSELAPDVLQMMNSMSSMQSPSQSAGPNTGNGLDVIAPSGLENAKDSGKSPLSQIFPMSKLVSGVEKSLSLSGASVEQTFSLPNVAPLPGKVGTVGQEKGRGG